MRGSVSSIDPGPARCSPDQLSLLLSVGRQLYLAHLERYGARVEPLGVVIETRNFSGRVIFEPPVLLPEEQFLELDLLRRRTHGRLRQRR